MASGWWDNDGAIAGCVAAYAPVGAADLASSYVNLVTPGTYDAAPGVAPTWDAATGWTFNGSTQWLNLPGLASDLKPVSFIARLTQSAGVNGKAIIASSVNGGYSWDSDTRIGTFGNFRVMRLVKMNLVVIGSMNFAPEPSTDTVVAVTYSATGAWVQYINGALKGSGTNDQTLVSGVLRITGQTGRFFGGNIAALAVYSGVLTLADVQTITTRMNALPEAPAGSALPILLAQHAMMG